MRASEPADEFCPVKEALFARKAIANAYKVLGCVSSPIG